MRASTAYFAGAGTVIAAIVGGLGGGLLIADIVSPKSPKQGTETTRLERHMASAPIPAAATPSEPVPYLSAPQLPAPGAAIAAAPAQPQAQTEAANSASTAARPADTSLARQPEASSPQPATPAVQTAAREPTAAPEETFAKARDADVKRAEEKRRAERRQQWAEKRRQRQQQELRAVEIKVREEIEPRQEFMAERVRSDMPQIRLFGPE
jgi:hypothetical protein